MTRAEYLIELKNILNKINRQTWTEIKMLEGDKIEDPSRETGLEDQETLNKAKQALTTVAEILGRI